MARMLNTGNYPSSKTFFELLRFFDVETQRNPTVSFTKKHLEQLLLKPNMQGKMTSMLTFACELKLLEEKNGQYSKAPWLPLWKDELSQEQLVVTFFVFLSRALKRWAMTKDNAIEIVKTKPGEDLIFSLCWALLLRPQKIGFGNNVPSTLKVLRDKHRVHIEVLNELTVEQSRKGFEGWMSELNLIQSRYVPMAILSDTMIEFILSKKK